MDGAQRARSVREGVEQYTELLDSSDPDAIAIALSIWEINGAQRLANERAFERLNLPVSVAGSRISVLRTLYFAPERRLSLGTLSRDTGLTLSWIISLVKALGDGGLVQRVGSPQDRRVSIVCLTSAGEEAFRSILPAMAQAMSETCKRLSKEEKHQLLNLLHRLL
jgi:DNA-binding MarR family transcriptional regulator